MLSFGNDEYADGGLKLSGNIGVRYVDTKLRSAGAFGIPTATNLGVTDPYDVRCALQPPPDNAPPGTPPSRSEEHTSELQSLMRISYAVFCLKKKKRSTPQPIINFITRNRPN